MSLINQMLQDLESRRATLNGGSGVSQEIRSLPPQRLSLPWARLLIGVGIVVLGGIGGWWWFSETHDVSAPPPVVAGTASAPAMPAPVVASAAPPPAVAPAPFLPSSMAASQTQPLAAVPAEAEKATAPISAPPARAEFAREPIPQARKEALKPRSQESREGGLRVATSLGSAPSSESAAAGDDTRIEKRMRMSTPRERAENEYRRALGLVNQGRVQEGMAVLRGALSEDPGHAGSQLALFGLLVEQQRLEEAQALLQEALARDPSQPQLASRLARLQLERGDARSAEETLNKAAAAAAGNAEFRGFHAAVLQRLNRHKEAVGEYQAALRLSPQAGVWWMGLGISLEADGKLSEAREAFQRAKAAGTLSLELSAFVDQKLRRLQ